MSRYEEIERLLSQGVGVRSIARSLGCHRRTVREVRAGKSLPPDQRESITRPLWAQRLNWDEIFKEVSAGHPLRLIWQEKAECEVSYGNFRKQFHRQFPFYQHTYVLHREFEPGSVCEVDWAGGALPWTEVKTGELHEARIFMGALGFSQKIFAYAKADMKERSFLGCHIRMYKAFGGVPRVTVPDNLKTGVIKSHRYDPDLHTAYRDLANHYGTAIVPARAYHPKDKAIVEGAVKLASIRRKIPA